MKRPKTAVRRIVLVAMAAFAAWHIFATFLWVAPVSPLREVVPDGALRSYMLPMFGQSWSVFAPSPISGDYHLDVRALVGDGDGLTETQWIRPTAVELSYLQHNLAPPRAAGVGVSATSDVYSEFRDLSDEAQETVTLNYFKEDWQTRLAAAVGEKHGDYIAAERTLTAYTTQVAYAVWGDDVERVQFRVTREPVIPFEQRNDPDAERPESRVQEYGWRGTFEYPGQSRDEFRDYFCSAPMKVCG